MITDTALISSSAVCFHNKVLIFVVPGNRSSNLQVVEVNTHTTEVEAVLIYSSFRGPGVSLTCSEGEQRLNLG